MSRVNSRLCPARKRAGAPLQRQRGVAASAAACAGLWLVAGLAGCAPSSSPDTLRFWAFGREGEVVAELVRDFEREHPGVHVRVQQIPWSAAHEKLLTAHVGDALPDMAQLGNTWIPEMVTLGALAPLDSLVRQAPDMDSTGHFPGIWATNVVEARVYGIPWYVDTRVLFYRKDILARAGYTRMPEHWTEWHQAMQAITRVMGPGHYAIFLPLNEWPPQVILGLEQGSPLITPQGYGAFADSSFARAFAFLLSLYRDGLAPSVSSTEVANLYQEFGRGTFAMYITGPWNIGEFRRRLPPELQHAWTTAPLPGPTGPESGVSLAGGSSLVVFRASKHRALAWELIRYLSRPDVQLRFSRLTGDLPARREAWNDSTLAADSEAQAFRIELGRAVPTPMIPEWEEVTTKIMDQTEAAVRGGTTPAQALATLDRDVNRLLERRRFLLAQRAAPPVAPAR
jgi:multiple sugar transport system substrate-binding protein